MNLKIEAGTTALSPAPATPPTPHHVRTITLTSDYRSQEEESDRVTQAQQMALQAPTHITLYAAHADAVGAELQTPSDAHTGYYIQDHYAERYPTDVKDVNIRQVFLI